MADVNANIDINIDSSDALASLKSLQNRITQFNTSVIKSNAAAVAAQRNLLTTLNAQVGAAGQFSTSIANVESSVNRLGTAIDRNKLSLGEYFKYGVASTRTFGRVFAKEHNSIMDLAQDRVKRLQTQYIALEKAQNGATKAMALRPMSLFNADAAIAIQRQQLFNKLLHDGSTSLINFGKNTQWAGRQLMVGFSVPLAAFGMAASKTFMDLDKQARDFKRVYGDVFTPPEEIQQNLDAVQKLGKEYTKYGISLKDTMSIASTAAAAGMKNDKLMGNTEQSLRLATIGQIDYQQALTTTITLQNAFKISNEQLGPTVDFIGAVANQTVLTVDDLTAAIPRVAPVIQGLGGDVKDLAVMLVAMKEGGVSAEQGANALKSGLASLINPTKAATKTAAQFGINIKGIVEANRGDLMGTVQAFGAALSKLDEFSRQQVLEKVFGKYQFARIGALFDNINQKTGQVKQSMDLLGMSTQDLATLSDKSLNQIAESTTAKFQSAVEQLKIAIAPIGEIFLKVATPILEFASKLLDKFNDLSPNVKQFVTILAVGLGVVAPLAIMLVGLFANFAGNAIKGFSLMNGLINKIRGGGSVFKYMTTEELDAAAAAASLEGKTNQLTAALNVQKEAVMGLAASYESYIVAANAAAGSLPQGFRAPMRRMATGGVVPGSGNGDTIPALLTPGESVVTKKATQKYGPIIAAMNAGTIQGFVGGLSPDVPGVGIPTGAIFGARAAQGIQAWINANRDLVGVERIATSALSILSEKVDNAGNSLVITTGKFVKMVEKITAPLTSPGGLVAAHATENIRGGAAFDAAISSNPKYAALNNLIPGSVYATSSLTANLPAKLNQLLGPGGGANKTQFAQGWSLGGADKFSPAATAMNSQIAASEEAAAALRLLDERIGRRVLQLDKELILDSDLAAATKAEIEIMKRGTAAEKMVADALSQAANTIAELRVSIGAVKAGAQAAGASLQTLAGAANQESAMLISHPSIPGGSMQYGRKGVTSGKERPVGRIGSLFGPTDQQVAEYNARLKAIGNNGGTQLISGLVESVNSGTPQVTQAFTNLMSSMRAGGNAGIIARSPSLAAKETVGFYLQGAIQETQASLPKMHQAGFEMFSAFNAGAKEAAERGMLPTLPKPRSTSPIMPPPKDYSNAVLQPNKFRQSVTAAAKSSSETLVQGLKRVSESGKEISAAAQTAGTQMSAKLKEMASKTFAPLMNQTQRNVATRKGVYDANLRAAAGKGMAPMSLPQVPGILKAGLMPGAISSAVKDIVADLRSGDLKIKEGFASIGKDLIRNGKMLATNLSETWNGMTGQISASAKSFVPVIDSLRMKIGEGANAVQAALKQAAGKISSVASSGKNWLMAPNAEGVSKMQNLGKYANSAAMGLMGVSLAASMVPGPIGEMAQKIMPVTMGLMGLQMMLPMLTNPIGIATLAIAGLAAGALYLNKIQNDASKKAQNFASAMVATTDAVKDVAKFYGTSRIVDVASAKRTEEKTGINSAELQKAKDFLSTDVGKSMSDGLSTALSTLGTGGAAKQFAANLSSMILQGVISTKQAKAIALAMGEQLNNKSFAITVNGKLNELLGPNEENLLKDPLHLAVLIDRQTVSNINAMTDSITGASSAVENLNSYAMNINADSLFGSVAKGIRGFFSSDTKNAETQLEAIGATIGGSFAQSYANLAAAKQRYNDITDKAAKLDKNDVEGKRKAEIEANLAKQKVDQLTTSIQKQRDAYSDLYKSAGTATEETSNAQSAILTGMEQSLSNAWKDNPLMESAFKAISGDIGAQSGQLRFKIYTELQSGGIDPLTLQMFSGMYENKGAAYSEYINLVASVKGDSVLATNFIQSLTGNSLNSETYQKIVVEAQLMGEDKLKEYTSVLEKTQILSDKELRSKIVVDGAKLSIEELKDVQAGLDGINQLPEEFQKLITVDTFGINDAKRIGKILTDFDKIPKKNKKQLIAEFLKINFADVSFGIDWFNKLPDYKQKNFLVNYTVTFDEKGNLTPLGMAALLEAHPSLKNVPGLSIADYRNIARSDVQITAEAATPPETVKPPGTETLPNDQSGSSPMKDLMDSLLLKAQQYNDLGVKAKDLFGPNASWRKNFDNAFLNSGLSQVLRKAKMPETMIADLMSKGADGIKLAFTLLNKNKNGLNDLGQRMTEVYQKVGVGTLLNNFQQKIDSAKLKSRSESILGKLGFSEEDVKTLSLSEEEMNALIDAYNKGGNAISSVTQKFKEFLSTQNPNVLDSLQSSWSKYADIVDAAFDLEKIKKEKEFSDKFLNDNKMTADEMQHQIDLNNKLIQQEQAKIDKKQSQIDVYQHENDMTQQHIDDLNREVEMRNRVSDAISHDLDILSQKENEIKKTYDARIKALNTISSLNQHIAEQQQNQLNVAKAFSEGDIYAAALAANQMSQANAQYAQQQQQAALEQGMNNAVAGLRTQGGLTRDQAEQQIANIKEQNYQTSLQIRQEEDKIYANNLLIRDLNNEIYTIQNGLMKTYEQQNKTYETTLQNHNADLQYALAHLSAAGMTQTEWDNAKTAQQKLVDSIKNNAGDLMSAKNTYEAIAAALERAKTAASGINVPTPSIASIGMQGAGQGMLLYTGGMVPKKYATGGHVNMDSMPAMLTPGEFVMRKAAVKKYGANMLSSMNMGALDMPRYNLNGSEMSMPVQSGSNISNISAPVYNTYSINVPVTQPNATADEIANKVIMKIKHVDASAVRSNRGY